MLTTDIVTGTTFLDNVSDVLRPSPELDAMLGRDRSSSSRRR